MIHKLYDFVVDNRRKGKKGVFADEKPRSYWEKGFMSAALRSYLEFRIARRHKERLNEKYQENKDLPPEEISKILLAQEIEDIKQLVPPGTVVDFKSWEGKEVLRQCKTRILEHFDNDTINCNFARFEGKPLILPKQHPPDLRFLAKHRRSWGF